MPTLLSNASATGSEAQWGGGQGLFIIVGTFTTASVSLQYLGPDGSTYVDVGADTVMTANGMALFTLPPGLIKATVTGTGSGLYAEANQVHS